MKTLLHLAVCCLLFSCAGEPTSDTAANADRSLAPVAEVTPVRAATNADDVTSTGPRAGIAPEMRTKLDPRTFRKLPGFDIARNQRITGARGETVLIPANSLVDEQGRTVKGDVQVTWSAALSPGEFFTMNAPTVADGQLLASGGSIYLNAEQDGRPLRIKEGMDWSVTIPSEPVVLFPEATMKVFSGNMVRGQVEWALEPEERIETIPLSYKFFGIDQRDMIGRAHFARIDSLARKYPQKNNVVMAPRPEHAVGRDKAAIARLALAFYTDPRYEDSYVCSLPFLERLKVLTEHVFSYKRSMNDIHYMDERTDANRFIIDILTIYQERAGGDLYQADSMAYALLAKSELIHTNTPSTTAIHLGVVREAFNDFLAQHLTKPIIIDDRGVDLSAPGAFDKLVCKGLSLAEASRILEDHADRTSAIEGLKAIPVNEPLNDGTVIEAWTERLPDGRTALVRKRQTYTVRFSGGFGYINCDRFMDPTITSPVNLAVAIDGPELTNERVCMFFPALNSYLELERHPTARLYVLPGNLRRLPPGQDIVLLAVGRNADGYAYQLLDATVNEKMSFRLKPEAGDMEALTDRLARI